MFLQFFIFSNLIMYLIMLMDNLAFLKLKKYLFLRKAKLSPTYIVRPDKDAGAFFPASLKGSLTVEAAVVLPVFIFVMIAVLQYGAVMGTSARLGNALSDTGKTIATAAYLKKYGGDRSVVPEIAAAALTEAYAQGKVLSKAGNPDNIKNANMLLSSFNEDEMIDLVLTYQIKSPVGIIALPGNFFIQRARVRAWTGRVPPSGDGENEEKEKDDDYVYVTVTGKVYHEDPNCTHLKLSIQAIDAENLSESRNKSGGKYHACEKCGDKNPHGTVYITNEGDRYHSSLECSGLKRTTRQVHRDDIKGMRVCSKCGK